MPNITIVSADFKRTMEEIESAFPGAVLTNSKGEEMSAKTEAAAKAAEKRVLVPTQDPVFISTDSGAVTVYGHEHVSKKDLIILGHCLSLPEFSKDMAPAASSHNVKSVVFRTDNRPKSTAGEPILANCAFDCGAITINLLRTVSVAIEDAMENNEVSIVASYHRNMIINYLHEIHHLSTLDDVPSDPELKAEVEEDANAWAMDCLIYLAKNTDLEPSHHAESSFLSGQLMELLAENDDEWAIEQRRMLDNHIMYLLPATDTEKELAFYNFKGYIQVLSGDIEGKDWCKDTILGAGAVNPYEEAVKAISTPIPVVHTPVSAMPTTSQVVLDEHMDDMADYTEDYYGGPAVDPNALGFAATNTMFPIAGMAQAMMGMQAAPQEVIVPVPANPMSAAPNPAPTPQKPAAKPYPHTGFTDEQTAEIVFNVFNKCYTHIFTHCGRLLNSDKGFSNPQAVSQIPLPLTEAEMRVVVKMDCVDGAKRWCPNMPTSAGKLLGGQMLEKGLPYYKLYINMNGQEIVRLLLPQNPNTRDHSGQYKKTAMAARNGSCIMYVFEGNDALVAAGGQKLKWKNVDGTWTKC
jgi:hypothetical protein